MRKKHWYTSTLDTQSEHPLCLDLACGRAGWLGSAKEGGPHWVECSASVFVDLSAANPDWYCVTCAKAARLTVAKASAPKPEHCAVWPAPRPITEAPKDEVFFGYVPEERATMASGWYRMTAATNESDEIECWVILGATPSKDTFYAVDRLKPTHFLPMPPEPKK